ncbi:hypothetical protein EHS25_003552 [Saitozyma podzolica]|uniref:Uncharacterized protein n=1 Tax=Saitozyma podzolica TaxID=1890683 RepID=A0A427Y7J2_9TREE|nr:hypothetical protein EHS25_003552 [Saitozyma podzolica]
MTAQTQTKRRVKVAVLGVGLMGKHHARNIAYFDPNAELVAVSDIKPEALEWARAELPPTVKTYSSSEELLANPEVEAVLIATETAKHADLAIKSIRAGKASTGTQLPSSLVPLRHSLIEKPISLDADESKRVVAEAKLHPELKVMVAFSRRFDESYNEAAARIKAGKLGTPYLIKSCTNDKYDSTGRFLAYSKHSGGIFIDCGIHDIDIGRWLLDVGNPAKLKNPTKQVTRVFATGLNTVYPELEAQGDCDNAIGVIEFENGTKFNIHLSRTSMHGHDVICEVFGTESKLVINENPNISRVEIRDAHGVRMESHPSFYERFKGAFVTEIQTFSKCILDDIAVPTPPQDALEAAQIAMALTHSFRTGMPVFFGDDGQPIFA